MTSKGNVTVHYLQYLELKQQYPDVVLLFHVGDFLEAYGEDAQIVADVLGLITVDAPFPGKPKMKMAGFPFAALETQVSRLLAAGHHVGMCEAVFELSMEEIERNSD